MKIFLEAAIKAARKSGLILIKNLKKTKKIDYKGKFNLVTNVDKLSQNNIIKIIKREFPEHGILAEEKGGQTDSSSPFKWIIDPLDGTTNYAHGYPCFCVSIALEKKGDLVLGIIYNPCLEELFVAEKNKGAFLNGRRIEVSKTRQINRSLLATGFPYDKKKRLDHHLRQFRRFLDVCHGVRRDGSAALNLCYLAMGRFDGFWEMNLSAWDTAAGSLMVREAGGKISDFRGRLFSHYGRETLASNGLIHKEMFEILSKK